MRGVNKLLEPLRGTPIVVRVVERVLEAGVAPVAVVVGHQAERVADALTGHPIELVPNPRWMEGLSTSLRAGVAALEGRVEAALICLGDMPRVSLADLSALLSAYESSSTGNAAACVPMHGGRRGNPVLWSAGWFPALRELQGDRGARGLLAGLADQVLEVPTGPGVLLDIDTPDKLNESRKED